MRGFSDSDDRDAINTNRRRRRSSSSGSTFSHHVNNNNNNNNNNIQRLNIDGFFFDSTAVATMLKNDGLLFQKKDTTTSSHQQQQDFQGREIIFRNIAIDKTVLDGARELLEKKDQAILASNTDIDILHCSGLVSELLRIVLPTTRRFGFAGTIPIAHNLDAEGLSIIGETLKRNTSSNVPLKSLVLKGTRLESSGFQHFCDGLRVTSTLEELQLSTCILQEEDVLLLADSLKTNRSLKSVFFANCKFGTKPTSTTTTTARANNLNNRQNNRRVVESTQSINNIHPQIHLPVVLEALIGHPKLESLQLYDMVCNDHSIRAIGDILEQSKLKVLGLKNNLSHPKGKLPGLHQHLFPALSRNASIISLKLSGNNLNDQHMIQLGTILTTSNTSIQSLSISDNLISNGLLSLASNLHKAKSLRCLDVLRNPIHQQSKQALVKALETNTELERLDLDGSWDAEKFWWLSLNRGGRRALKYKSLHSSLWPKLLERAYKVPVRRNSKQTTFNVGVVYYLIRRIPWLFEKASTTATTTSTTAATTTATKTTATTMAIVTPGKSNHDTTPVLVSESRPDQKRQREPVDDDSTETFEPKAKRIFHS